ncbi:hypothetical protein MTO96_024797 [Rhipicephalus appendiculatus]
MVQNRSGTFEAAVEDVDICVLFGIRRRRRKASVRMCAEEVDMKSIVVPTVEAKAFVGEVDAALHHAADEFFSREADRLTEGLRKVHVVGARLENRRIFCGGSIITRDTILTAAHCVVSKKFRIRPVTVYYNTTIVRRGPCIRVKSVVVHENYTNPFLGYDIALLKLAKPIPQFDRFVGPVCLPEQGEKTRKGPMLVAGYGRPTYGIHFPLRTINVLP